MTILAVVGAILFGVIALGVWAARRRRTELRRAFRAYLEERRPDITVVRETSDAFVLCDAEKNDLGTLYLHRIYREAPADPSEWRELFGKVVAAIGEAEAALQLDAEQIRRRIMPRMSDPRAPSAMRTPTSPVRCATP